jgi:hypothetical protein
MGPSLMQRQCPVTPDSFPGSYSMLCPHSKLAIFYPRCPVAEFQEAYAGEGAKLLFQPVPERSQKDRIHGAGTNPMRF